MPSTVKPVADAMDPADTLDTKAPLDNKTQPDTTHSGHAISPAQLQQLLEAAIFAHPTPLDVAQLRATVLKPFRVSKGQLERAFAQLQLDYADRGVELVHTASGYHFRTKPLWAPYIALLFPERTGRYSKAVLETLVLIAYRQPITRGEIEAVRGVAVSSSVIKTLLDRQWIHAVGNKEVPGRPALYATTATFLDDFGLRSLDQLPALPDVATPSTTSLSNTVGMTEE
jgi:segregation and condensation protein B